MPGWTELAGWMRFDALDDGDHLSGVFTIAYKITDDGTEAWSARFTRFKAKDQVALSGAIALLERAVPHLVGALGLDARQVVCIPALGSKETVASRAGLTAALASSSAAALGAQFELSAVAKNAHKPLHGIYNADDRQAELDKAAYVAQPVRANSILLFDDFITRGSTLSRIAGALLASNRGASVYGIALGKTERRRWVPDLSNAHVPAAWNELWEQGEDQYKRRKR